MSGKQEGCWRSGGTEALPAAPAWTVGGREDLCWRDMPSLLADQWVMDVLVTQQHRLCLDLPTSAWHQLQALGVCETSSSSPGC